MKYLIKTKPFETEVEADSPEDAMVRFATIMDTDMNHYFEAQKAAVNTRMVYLYRDAANFKAFQEIILIGQISKEQRDIINDALEEGTYFIPEQIGLPLIRGWSVTEDDQCYCELDPNTDFEPTWRSSDIGITVEELVKRFEETKEWKPFDVI